MMSIFVNKQTVAAAAAGILLVTSLILKHFGITFLWQNYIEIATGFITTILSVTSSQTALATPVPAEKKEEVKP